jgi:hypothetical protein
VDPQFSQAPGWTPYRAFFNNPIYYLDETGGYELPTYLANKYPQTAKFFKNVKAYYEGTRKPSEDFENFPDELYDKLFNEKQRNAFLEITGNLPKEDLDYLLTDNTGPTIDAYTFGKGFGETGHENTKNGPTNAPGYTPNAEETQKSGGRNAGVIYLDITMLADFERALGGPLTGTKITQEESTKAIKLFVITLSHESVHWARFRNNLLNDIPKTGESCWGQRYENIGYSSETLEGTDSTVTPKTY